MNVKLILTDDEGEQIELSGTSIIFAMVLNEKHDKAGAWGRMSGTKISDLLDKMYIAIAGSREAGR